MSKHKRKKKKVPQKHRLQRITSSSLEDKIRESGILPKDKIRFVKGTGEKMSEVLLDFAEPLLAELEDEDYKSMGKAISFAMAIWNSSLLPENEQKKGLEDILEIVGEDDPEMRNVGEYIVRMLLDRKKKYFPNNKRFIIDYEFGMKNGQSRLNVASTVE